MFSNKKNKKILLIGTITLGLIFCFNFLQAEELVPAEQTEEENVATEVEVVEEKNENKNLTKYEKTYYWGGDNLSIEGNFLNDVIVAGNNITLDGIIEGDVVATGYNVNINADVKGNIRVAAGNININSIIYKNATLAAGQININKNAEIKKDLIAYGGTVQILAPINGELKTGASQLTIDNTIAGDADLGESGQVNLGSNALIAGNLKYIDHPDLNIGNLNNKVQGEINKVVPEIKNKDKAKKNFLSKYKTVGFWVWATIKLMALLLVGLVVVGLFKNTTKKTIANMYCCPGKNILWGFLFTIVAPMLIIACMITIIGLPLAMLGLAAYIMILYIAGIFVGVIIGKQILSKSDSLLGAAFIGIIVFCIIKTIPIFGMVFCLITTMWATGALLRKKCCCENCQTEIVETKKIKTNTKTKAKKTTKKTNTKKKK